MMQELVSEVVGEVGTEIFDEAIGYARCVLTTHRAEERRKVRRVDTLCITSTTIVVNFTTEFTHYIIDG